MQGISQVHEYFEIEYCIDKFGVEKKFYILFNNAGRTNLIKKALLTPTSPSQNTRFQMDRLLVGATEFRQTDDLFCTQTN